MDKEYLFEEELDARDHEDGDPSKARMGGGFAGGRWISKGELSESIRTRMKLRIKPSTIPDAGVGVFAVKKLYKGEVVAVSNNWPLASFTADEIEAMNLSPEQRILLDDMTFHDHVRKETDVYASDFHQLDITHFFNDCFVLQERVEPNVEQVENPARNLAIFKALRDIEEGEELLIDYEGYSFVAS